MHTLKDLALKHDIFKLVCKSLPSALKLIIDTKFKMPSIDGDNLTNNHMQIAKGKGLHPIKPRKA